MNKKVQAVLQRMAKAFLVPISLISFGGLALAVGAALTSADLVKVLPFLSWYPIVFLADALVNIGLIVLANLHVIYAIALAFSFADEHKEIAAMAGFIGYFSFVKGMNYLITCFPAVKDMFPAGGISTVLGVETVNANIVGGIVAGVICGLIHNRFKDIELPVAFTFFNGTRFTPIACLTIMYFVGIVFPFAWVWIAKLINLMGSGLNRIGIFGPFVYGTVERLLIPTGLHQIWNSLIRTTSISGEYTFASGATATGVTQAYAQYLVEGLPVSPPGVTLQELVKYQFGPQIPIMLGALPGICLAMYHCAEDNKKESVKGMFLSAALTAVFAAVSEPVEFVFLFAAPVLYFVVYSLLNGLSWLLCYVLGSGVGGGESSIIGLVVHGFLQPKSNVWVVCILTVIYFVLFYFLFKWWIVKFDVKTPGRGGEDYDDQLAFAQEIAGVKSKGGDDGIETKNPEIIKAQKILEGLGGKDNIEEIENCFTRLRVVMKDPSKFDEKLIKTTGCNGISHATENEVQIVYGAAVNLIYKTINKLIAK